MSSVVNLSSAERVRRIRMMLAFIVIGLLLSGISAFPIENELRLAQQWFHAQNTETPLSEWIAFAYEGVHGSYANYPFLAYGTDWLAYAHIILAILFIGPIRYPLRNIWVIKFGIIASAGVIPLAFIAGEIRGIPIFWRLIDCMFGVCSGVILTLCYRHVCKLAGNQNNYESPSL